MSLQRALIGLRLPVQTFAGELHSEVQRCGTAGKCNCIFHACVFCNVLFDLIDILTGCGDPVFYKCVVDPLLLVTVHCGG